MKKPLNIDDESLLSGTLRILRGPRESGIFNVISWNVKHNMYRLVQPVPLITALKRLLLAIMQCRVWSGEQNTFSQGTVQNSTGAALMIWVPCFQRTPYGGIIRNKAGLLVQTNLQIKALNTVLWDLRSHYMY